MRSLVSVALLTAIFCAPNLDNSPSSTSQTAIREAEKAWGTAIASKSLDRTVKAYAQDAVTAGSAMFRARGIADFRAEWAKQFSQPDFSLTWKTENVVVTNSGVIAYSSGTWSQGGDHGPYLAVWQKQPNGEWKVLIDEAWSTH
jgi:ketosteroid isomerase-like protein